MPQVTGIMTTNVETRPVEMATDLSAKQYYFVTLDAAVDNRVALAVAGTVIAFPLIDGKDGSVNVAEGSIAVSGQTKIILNATIAAGVPVMPDGGGKAVAATDGKYFSGVTMQAGVAGDLVLMDVCHGVYKTVS